MTARTSLGPEAKLVDRTVLLVVPGVCLVLMLFLYPFLYGLALSFTGHAGFGLGNYARFFSTPFQSQTIATTLWISLPATLVNVGLPLSISLLTRQQGLRRILPTILVLPLGFW